MKLTYLGDLRTELLHERSGSIIHTDAPTDNNGKGEKFSPTDMMASSLASCMVTIMGIRASKWGKNLGRITCDIEKVMASDPRRIAKIVLHLEVEGGELEPKEILELKHAALHCPVALSIHPDIEQDVTIEFKETH